MKKILLFIATGLIAGNLNAQDRKVSSKANHALPPAQAQPQARFVNATPAAVIYTQDFAGGLPADWGIIDHGTNAEIWTYTTVGPMGPSAGTGDTLMSPTASNGFMIMDDDLYGSNGTIAHTDLVSGAINCSTNSAVRLSFYEFYRIYTLATDSAIVYVSNDSINWVDIYHAETGLASGDATPNPHLVDIDISAVAANQATVYVMFKYHGDWGYFW